eukprot:NODE_84_length_2185_cov_250.991080.p1 GENE.NODE_84_length_2185_cov_250.991080~~NODE_84_length_2185_cov_250.991080.p1  ORF type:complete len:675 (+),score=255.98 NODE_84_length_2185_cov_250.991080:3-2027(+)
MGSASEKASAAASASAAAAASASAAAPAAAAAASATAAAPAPAPAAAAAAEAASSAAAEEAARFSRDEEITLGLVLGMAGTAEVFIEAEKCLEEHGSEMPEDAVERSDAGTLWEEPACSADAPPEEICEEAAEDLCEDADDACEPKVEGEDGEPEELIDDPDDETKDTSDPKITAKGQQKTTHGAVVSPGKWAITAEQLLDLRETHRALFQEGAGMNARDFVEQCVKKSHVDGRGVALTYNDDEPKTVNVMVSHCWDEAMDVFLLDVLSMTHGIENAGMFICFLSVYQGTYEEVNLQVTQGSTNASEGCFAEVLRTVKENRGNMLVVSNAAVCSTGGLYSRLWCVWEVYCAVRDDVPLVIHPRTRTEQHLYGGQGEKNFNPKKARCGKPGSKQTADEISIRRTIGGDATTPDSSSDWARIKAVITKATRSVYGDNEPGALVATDCAFHDRGVELLVEAMKEDPWAYTKIRLRRCNIDNRGAKALAEALQTNKTLTHLWLGGNQIGNDGAKALAEALRTNNALRTLSLYGNQIGNDGAEALADALTTNNTLVYLDLESNRIFNDGAKALAEALRTNDTLNMLNLDSNHIGNDGAKALAEALQTNSTLTHLSLLENQIGNDGAKALAEALQTNNTLTHLLLYSNQIGNDGAKALRELQEMKKAKGFDLEVYYDGQR